MNSELEQHAEEYSVALVLKSICAWCSRVLREGIEPPTHGICDACICRLCDISLEDLAARRVEWAAELASGEVETTPSSEHQGVSQVRSDADPERSEKEVGASKCAARNLKG